ncbi:transcription factor Tfb4 [Wallemia mellicola]|uniref:General transcription and DNA repair factor IIH subunit TFB4 n=1 Tax=Wallemia mellicola TaxID=1708541 RepID=A0AB74KDB8_9BASI|nr:hypothetical protein E3Q24_02386 [Wallemia mellicola]TIC06428.1 transcription factor Tfb4 [Wallemia mellicola]TIC61296.1 transcription factor Tfb4 [Wallemia mellicola]
MSANHLSLVADIKNKNLNLNVIKQLLIFINAHLSNSDLNSASIHINTSILLDTQEDDIGFGDISERFIRYVNNYYIGCRNDVSTASSTLASTLAQSLCHVNRKIVQESKSTFRILVVAASDDVPSEYVSLMNSIFAAQKSKIVIDVVQIYNCNTIFLQQAAHLTGGNFIQATDPESLVQYLIMAFLPSQPLRARLVQPRSDKVDFRAACFCHKRIVDIAYICSVCLSIFCQPPQRCSTCNSVFPAKTLQKFTGSSQTHSHAPFQPSSLRESL